MVLRVSMAGVTVFAIGSGGQKGVGAGTDQKYWSESVVRME